MTGYFPSNGKCVQCNSSCTACSNSPTTCSACATGFVLQGNTCQPACNLANYEYKSTCFACQAACSSCVGGGINQCTGCNDGYLLNDQNTCVPGCVDGKYLDNGACKPCVANCQICTSANQCNVPVPPFFVDIGVPVANCSNGKYASDTRQCKPCDTTCASCSGGNKAQCITCVTGLLLDINQCLTQCPTGKYNNNSTCVSCNSNCSTCQNGNSCTGCATGLVL